MILRLILMVDYYVLKGWSISIVLKAILMGSFSFKQAITISILCAIGIPSTHL